MSIIRRGLSVILMPKSAFKVNNLSGYYKQYRTMIAHSAHISRPRKSPQRLLSRMRFVTHHQKRHFQHLHHRKRHQSLRYKKHIDQLPLSINLNGTYTFSSQWRSKIGESRRKTAKKTIFRRIVEISHGHNGIYPRTT